MSGTYGIIRPSDFNPNDHAEVWLSYRESRNSIGDGFSKVDTTKYLTIEPDANDNNNQINGLYQLKLPLDVFNRVGIYNIYIKPKTIKATIKDVGVLYNYPNIRGIILDSSELAGIDSTNDALVGYRIEYYDGDTKRTNFFRIVTSNNRCESTNQNVKGSVSYRFNDSANQIFLTLSPSSASSSRPSSLPYIGVPGATISITNTFFNPEMIEIEMVNNDIESLYLSINGNQIRDLDRGLLTTFNQNNEIVSQTEHYLIKESATGTPIYEVKQNKSEIDFSVDYNEIISTE